MKNLLRVLTLAMLLFAGSIYAKEVAVLLPVTGSLTPFEKTELGKTVELGFSAQFIVRHGEDVDDFVKKTFQEESKKNDCDEINCYRRIAAHYHAAKIIALRVIAADKGADSTLKCNFCK